MWTKDLFGTDKPIIALLHLDALPGEPAFCGSLVPSWSMRQRPQGPAGRRRGRCLIANEYCFPITPHTSTVTLMAMAAVIGSLKKDIRVPFGVNVVYNPEETIKMAARSGCLLRAQRLRRRVHPAAYGLHSVNYGDMVRLKYTLGHPEIQLLCKFNPEGDAAWAHRPPEPGERALPGRLHGRPVRIRSRCRPGGQHGISGRGFFPGQEKECSRLLQHRLPPRYH